MMASNIWKKTIACVSVAALVTMSFTACGSTAPEEAAPEVPDVVEEVSAPDEVVPEVNAVADYSEMVELYTTAMNEQWDWDALEANQLSTIISYYYDQGADSIGFCPAYDLDNDGNYELLIGEVLKDDGVENTIVFAAYTMKDDQVVPVFISSERDSYHLLELLENNPMAVNVVREGSNGAEDSFQAQYTVNNGELNLVQAVIYDSAVDAEHPWFTSTDTLDAQDAEPIEEDVARDIMESYESNYVFPGYLTISQGYFMPDPEWTEEDGEDVVSGAPEDMYLDWVNWLAVLNEVKAGSAGSSLRAEDAANEMAVFVQSYGDFVTPDDVTSMTKEWIEIMEESDEFSIDDFALCVEDVIAATEGKEVTTMTGYNYVCQGLMDAVK